MKKKLTAILDAMHDCIGGERVKVGVLVDSLNSRGFGPLLMIPALLVLSPIGALPGACAILGGIIFLVSLQILIGRDQPWLPERLRQMSFRSKKCQSVIKKARPLALRLDKYLENRVSVLVENRIVLCVTALVSIILSVGIISFSLIPFAPAAFALPIFFFALALSVHDGVLIAAGYIALFLVIMFAGIAF